MESLSNSTDLISVHPLHLRFENSEVWCVAARDGSDLYLVDCGMPWMLPALTEAVKVTGLSLENLRGVILTHHDYDHIGTLSALREQQPALQVYCGAAEAPYIAGEKKPLHLIRMEKTYAQAPSDAILQELEIMRDLQGVHVDIPLHGGELLPFCGGIRIINTPGHTHGHISVYFEGSGLLAAGDASVAGNGALLGPNPQFCHDISMAWQSLQHFLPLDIQSFVCAPGGPVAGSISQQLRFILADHTGTAGSN